MCHCRQWHDSLSLWYLDDVLSSWQVHRIEVCRLWHDSLSSWYVNDVASSLQAHSIAVCVPVDFDMTHWVLFTSMTHWVHDRHRASQCVSLQTVTSLIESMILRCRIEFVTGTQHRSVCPCRLWHDSLSSRYFDDVLSLSAAHSIVVFTTVTWLFEFVMLRWHVEFVTGTQRFRTACATRSRRVLLFYTHTSARSLPLSSTVHAFFCSTYMYDDHICALIRMISVIQISGSSYTHTRSKPPFFFCDT